MELELLDQPWWLLQKKLGLPNKVATRLVQGECLRSRALNRNDKWAVPQMQFLSQFLRKGISVKRAVLAFLVDRQNNFPSILYFQKDPNSTPPHNLLSPILCYQACTQIEKYGGHRAPLSSMPSRSSPCKWSWVLMPSWNDLINEINLSRMLKCWSAFHRDSWGTES